MDIKKAKILLIEDDLMNAQMYSLKFKLEGINLLVANTFSDGQKMIKEKEPDLILLDLELDDHQSGFDILKEVKLNSKTKNILVYALSNTREKENKKKSIELRAEDFISKVDVKPTEVVEIVREALKKI